MSPAALALASALLCTPPGVPCDPPTDPTEWAELSKALKDQAKAWELLDDRETPYVLARGEEFQNDLDLLRHRFEDLLDAPKLADVDRFPGLERCKDAVVLNRSYYRLVAQRAEWEVDRVELHRQVMRECDLLYQVHDKVRDARCEWYYVTVRRQALKDLKKLLGDEAYLSGTLPCPLPTWRLEDVTK